MKPDGAFYGFLHVDGLKDSWRFCQDMVRNDKVGVSPGWAFSLGDPRDDSYLRICFAQDASAPGRGTWAAGRGNPETLRTMPLSSRPCIAPGHASVTGASLCGIDTGFFSTRRDAGRGTDTDLARARVAGRNDSFRVKPLPPTPRPGSAAIARAQGRIDRDALLELDLDFLARRRRAPRYSPALCRAG